MSTVTDGDTPVPADLLLVERTGGVGVVTLNRPTVRNALSSDVLGALPAVLVALDDDPAVRAIILTGADPAFCAGLDLRELGSSASNLGADRSAVGGRHWPVWSPWPDLATPLVGAINGPAVTGGLELALHCDWLVASERARFADTHARIGVMPGWGMTVLLPEAVGRRAARDMSSTGRFVTADEALHLGLVGRVVPHAELLATALAVGEEIATNDPGALGTLLASYRHIASLEQEAGLRHEQAVSARWRRESFDRAAVDRRRDALIERGRSRL